MPVFQGELVVKGELRLSQEFECEGYRFSPASEGFNLVFEVEATSPEDARSRLTARAELLLDSLTFVKGPSLRYSLVRMTQKPTADGGALGGQLLTHEAFMGLSMILVATTNQDGINPALEMARQVSNHPKSELLTRVLRWYSRGVSDSDNVDRFVDFWVALEALADSYEGEDIQPHICQCGRLINLRPINGVMRAYLKSLGMKEDAELVSTISSARGDLFHRALTPDALKHIPDVQRILKICIQKEIDAT